MSFQLTSPSFNEGQAIPLKYSCEGQDISNPLVWIDPPAETVSFALINDDPDCSKPFVHWMIYNIPGHIRELQENFTRNPELLDGTLQGLNDFGKVGYNGPCPPSGTHRYFFKLYALDAILTVPPKATRKQLENGMKGHILGHAQLMGTYRKVTK